MDTFLLIVTIIIAVLLLFVNFYLLALYCHPDDGGWGASLFCKILVIIGLTLTWAQVLMLPLDAANSRGLGGGIDMDSFWKIIYMAILIMTTLLLPFAQYFYETDEDKSMRERCCHAIFQQICYIIIVALLLFISYGYLRFADIPVTVAVKSFEGEYIEDSASVPQSPGAGQKSSDNSLEYEVSFPVYAMAFMSFFGYFFFVLFGGVGLPALPMDLIQEFTERPKILTSKEGAERKVILKRKTEELIEQAGKIKEDQKEVTVVDGWWARYREKRKVQSKFNKFKHAVIMLERDHEIFKLELEYMNTNPIIWYLKFVIGLIFIVISFIWWLHIILFVATKTHPFLNDILTGLEAGNAGFIGTAVFAFLALYLLWCTQKGNIKFGVRIPFIFSLHIMKVNETWMNTFLFNVSLMLITSVAVTQFCAKAFQQYLRLSTLDMLFTTQIQYLRFFTWFYSNHVFEIALVVWSAICLTYLLLRRSDQPAILKRIEELQKQKK